MRLGGPVFLQDATPAAWAKEHLRLGYRAANVPASSLEVAKAYAKEATALGLVVAEIGAWSNPISSNEAERQKAFELCCSRLHMADAIGAKCCVNIVGSRGQIWDGPDPRNLTQETFDMAVECVRKIIDTVNPTRTFYTLETMPWIFPDSPESYLALIKAIDRKQFAVHLDVVNLINCPARAYNISAFIRECFATLGPYIKSCHAKDIQLAPKLTLHLDECRPGLGIMDYATFLREADKLHPETPIVLEHLPAADEYAAAAAHLKRVAAEVKVSL